MSFRPISSAGCYVHRETVWAGRKKRTFYIPAIQCLCEKLDRTKWKYFAILWKYYKHTCTGWWWEDLTPRYFCRHGYTFFPEPAADLEAIQPLKYWKTAGLYRQFPRIWSKYKWLSRDLWELLGTVNKGGSSPILMQWYEF